MLLGKIEAVAGGGPLGPQEGEQARGISLRVSFTRVGRVEQNAS